MADRGAAVLSNWGDENTSVQAILDEMNLSKGGFYHHFESKMALLEEICVHKAEAAYEEMEQVMYDGSLGAVDKLNALLGRSGLLDENNVDFLALTPDCGLSGRQRCVARADEAGLDGLKRLTLYERHPCARAA